MAQDGVAVSRLRFKAENYYDADKYSTVGQKIQFIYIKFSIAVFAGVQKIARFGQRQQMSREIKNMLPFPETRRNAPRSKAANILRNQESVAFAGDPKKRA